MSDIGSRAKVIVINNKIHNIVSCAAGVLIVICQEEPLLPNIHNLRHLATTLTQI